MAYVNGGGNFTMPAPDHNAGQDPGSDGQPVWDPKGGPNGTGAWSDGAPRRLADGAGGWSNVDSHGYGDGGAGVNRSGQPDTLGKSYSPGAWGGYNGEWIDDGNGGRRFDATHSGAADAVSREQGLAHTAATGQTLGIDYSDANRMAGIADQDRGGQADATSLARAAAMNGNQATQDLGRNMLQQGVQAQQAAALSTRGGSLAQAAAMQQQQAGQGAFMQRGEAQLAAQRADDMAAGRTQWGDAATKMRAGDMSAAGLAAGQVTNQADIHNAQADLSQRGQIGYDKLGQAVQEGSANAALGAHEQDAGISNTSSLRHTSAMDRGMGWVGDGVSAAGSLTAGAGGVGGAGTKPPGSDGSDERMKTRMRPLDGLAAIAARRWGR